MNLFILLWETLLSPEMAAKMVLRLFPTSEHQCLGNLAPVSPPGTCSCNLQMHLSFPVIQQFMLSHPQKTNENSQTADWRVRSLAPCFWGESAVRRAAEGGPVLSQLLPFPFPLLHICVVSVLRFCVDWFLVLALACLLSQLPFIRLVFCLGTCDVVISPTPTPESLFLWMCALKKKLPGFRRSRDRYMFSTLYLTPSCPNSSMFCDIS